MLIYYQNGCKNKMLCGFLFILFWFLNVDLFYFINKILKKTIISYLNAILTDSTDCLKKLFK